MRSSQTIMAVVLAMVLAGCGLNVPDPAPYVAGCTNVPVSDMTEEDEKQLFFMSTALPDCRKGGLQLANYRHPQRTFGSGTYAFISEMEPLSPTLAKHDEAEWLEALRQAVSQPGNNGRLLVFIHGYRTDFEIAHKDAVRVRALVAQDQPLVILHWPSRNRTTDYFLDEASIAWAQDSIDEVLAKLTTVADDIALVTHSMGARAGLKSVVSLEAKPYARAEHIRRIALASPDFDRHTALRDGGMVDQVLKHGRELLVYASKADVPLRLSRTAHGYARLGSTDCRYSVEFEKRTLGESGRCHLTRPRDGFAIVDTGPAPIEGALRHNDFLDSCHVRADLAAFLNGQEPPAYRVDVSEGELTGFAINPAVTITGNPCDGKDG